MHILTHPTALGLLGPFIGKFWNQLQTASTRYTLDLPIDNFEAIVTLEILRDAS